MRDSHVLKWAPYDHALGPREGRAEIGAVGPRELHPPHSSHFAHGTARAPPDLRPREGGAEAGGRECCGDES
eukprot:158973-Pyramimonas_sp.AAC.1